MLQYNYYSNAMKYSVLVHNCNKIILLRNLLLLKLRKIFINHRKIRSNLWDLCCSKMQQKPGDSAGCFWYCHICRLSGSGMLLLCNYLLKDLILMFQKDFAKQLEFGFVSQSCHFFVHFFLCRKFRTTLVETGRCWSPFEIKTYRCFLWNRWEVDI